MTPFRRNSAELRGGRQPPSGVSPGFSPGLSPARTFSQAPFNFYHPGAPPNITHNAYQLQRRQFQLQHQLAGNYGLIRGSPAAPLRAFPQHSLDPSMAHFTYPLVASHSFQGIGHQPLSQRHPSSPSIQSLDSPYAFSSPSTPYVGSGFPSTPSALSFSNYPLPNNNSYLPNQSYTQCQPQEHLAAAQGHTMQLHHGLGLGDLPQNVASQMPRHQVRPVAGFGWNNDGHITMDRGEDGQAEIQRQPHSLGANNIPSTAVYVSNTDDRRTFVDVPNGVENQRPNVLAVPDPVARFPPSVYDSLQQVIQDMVACLDRQYRRHAIEPGLSSNVSDIRLVSEAARRPSHSRRNRSNARLSQPQQHLRNGPEVVWEEDEDGQAAQQDLQDASSSERLFVCPFCLKYPHLIRRPCLQRFTEISYLKQHLWAYHHHAQACEHNCQRPPKEPGTMPKLAYSPTHPITSLLMFDSVKCSHIKKRENRSDSHIIQYKRIYGILFPEIEPNSSPSPYMDAKACKWLRDDAYKFMEKNCHKQMHHIYSQLPENVRRHQPDPFPLYGIAFCSWLPQAVERYAPHDARDFGDFLAQIGAVHVATLLRTATHTAPAGLELPSQIPDDHSGQQASGALALETRTLSLQSQSTAALENGHLPHIYDAAQAEGVHATSNEVMNLATQSNTSSIGDLHWIDPFTEPQFDGQHQDVPGQDNGFVGLLSQGNMFTYDFPSHDIHPIHADFESPAQQASR